MSKPVSVTMMYNHFQHLAVPLEIFIDHKHFPVTKHMKHEIINKDNTTLHSFLVASKNRNFNLLFNPADLTWIME